MCEARRQFCLHRLAFRALNDGIAGSDLDLRRQAGCLHGCVIVQTDD
jgi:hypothetical protein